uniref:Mitochondrial import inner membrane translocase subunit n=1 Tax=Pseudo-nitzschia delicatissima TaxID=44447 RepID=A0A7S0Y8N1_9STRA|mmetsp:Transcript_4692/g.9748  ORF Transcript_4692/g.9748 Transcript_4692/m.9748 type:complete len:102 (+) Transcript_4692:83-388(+)
MNFFGGEEAQPQGPDPVFAAKTEMEMYTDLFNKIASTCFSKCVNRKHKEPDLSLGEMTCTDRCVSKYLEGQQIVGVVLQKANEAQVQQAAAAQQMQQQFGG